MKIKRQSKKQLDAIKNFNISSKPLKEISFFSTLNYEARKLMIKIKQLDNWFDSAQLICTKTDGKTICNFSNFTFPLKFYSKIHNKYIKLQEAENNQQELKILINKLNKNYNPKINIKRKEKKDTLKSVNKLFIIREEIIKAFKNGIFPYIDNKVEKESEEESEEESKEKKIDESEFPKNIEDESKAFNYDLFEKHFNNVVPSALAKKLFETKDKKKNNDLVKLIKSGLHDLKNEIKEMSEEEIEIEKPDKILRIVEEILDFNKKNTIRRCIKNTNTK